MEFRSHYWDDPKAKAAFKRFMLDIHGLDFTAWDEAGMWDDAYTPFSFFLDGEVIANVCIYVLESVVNHANGTLLQISGVGTQERYRRQGLSRRLTTLGLNWAPTDARGVFLFADDAAIPYYQQTGFTEIHEFVETTAVASQSPRPGLRQLDPSKPADLSLIYEQADQREPISNKLSIQNPRLVTFHALYTPRSDAYEIPELACIVFMRREAHKLVIYDILAVKLPEFHELFPFIGHGDITEVEFHFHTDKLNVPLVQRRELLGGHPFTKTRFPVENVVFPFTGKA